MLLAAYGTYTGSHSQIATAGRRLALGGLLVVGAALVFLVSRTYILMRLGDDSSLANLYWYLGTLAAWMWLVWVPVGLWVQRRRKREGWSLWFVPPRSQG